MADKDEKAAAQKSTRGAMRLTVDRARELVRRIRSRKDEPFGSLSLVRQVTRRRPPGTA